MTTRRLPLGLFARDLIPARPLEREMEQIPAAARRTIVLTGGSDGIGAAAVRLLAARGHRVIVVGRNPEKTRAVAAGAGCQWLSCNYLSLRSVARLAEEIADITDNVHILINNAGAIFDQRHLTQDGFEYTFQVNHLAPFLLTQRLRPLLQAQGGARIITTSSIAAYLYADFHLDTVAEAPDFRSTTAYGNAKLANILFTMEADRRWSAEGVNAICFHPGVIASNFALDGATPLTQYYANPLVKRLMASPLTGARRMVKLVETPMGVGITPGGFVVADRVAPVPDSVCGGVRRRLRKKRADVSLADVAGAGAGASAGAGSTPLSGPSGRAQLLARELWEMSERLVEGV